MAEFVTLVLKADTAGLLKGKEALEQTAKAGAETEKATNKTGDAFKRTGNDAAAATPKVSGMSKAFSAAAVAAGALLGALSAGVSLNKFVSATIESEKAQAQLAATILSTGGAAGKSMAQLNENAAALQKVTNFGDDATNAMQGLLLTFTNIKGDQFDAATAAVLDLSTAMGSDLKSAALQVGKALNDPAKGMAALAEGGIQFTEAQKSAVTAMLDTNNIVGAQTIILGELERQFGGSAEAARGTLGGALESLGNSWGDLFEIAGPGSEALKDAIEGLVDTVSNPAFIGAVQSIGTAFFNTLSVVSDVLALVVNNFDLLVSVVVGLAVTQIPALVASMVTVTTGAGLMSVALSAAAAAGTALGAVVAFLGGPITLAVGAATALGTALYLTSESAEDLNAKAEATAESYRVAAVEAAKVSTFKLPGPTAEDAAEIKAYLDASVIANGGITEEMRKQREYWAKTRVESEAALSTAQEMLAALQQRNEIAKIEAQYGADSLQAAEARQAAEIATLAASLETLDVSASLKGEILAAAQAGYDLENAVSGVSGRVAQIAAAFGAPIDMANQLAAIMNSILSKLGGIGAGIANLIPGARQLASAFGAAATAAKNAVSGWVAPLSMGMGGLTDNVKALWTQATTAGTTVKDLKKTVEGFTPVVAGAGKATGGAAKEIAGAGGAAGGAAKEVDKLADEIKKLEFDANPALKYNEQLEHLNELAANGLSDGAYRKAVKDLNDEFAKSNPTINKVGDAIGNFVAGGLKDFKGLLNAFKNMIKEMIATAIANPIKLALTAGLTGGGATGAAAQVAGGGAGGGGILAKVGGIGSSFVSGASGLVTALTGAGGGLATAGTYLSSVLGGATSSIAGFAAAAGAIALPLAAVAAVFSFFKTKTKELDAGMRITASSASILVEDFKRVEKSKFWGLSKKVKTTYSVSKNADPVEQAIDDIKNSGLALGSVLGLTAANFASFSSQIQISLKGLSDDQAKAEIARALGVIADQFSYAALGWFQVSMGNVIKDGETASAAMERLVSSLIAVNDVAHLFGRGMIEMSVAGGVAASALVDLVGGLDAFNSKSAYVFSNMLTATEQSARKVAIATEQLNAGFADLGISIPQTHSQYMALMNAQNLMTESGRNTYAALLDMSAAFVEVNGTAQSAAQAAADLSQQASPLSKDIDTVNRTLSAMSRPIFDVTTAGRAMSASLVALMGGLDAFTSATSYFVANFYSDTEQLAISTRDLAAQFAAINVAVPASKEAFRALVNAQDLTTASGQALYAQLMALAPAFNDVSNATTAAAATTAAQELATAAQEAAAVASQRYSLETKLLGLQGNTVALRERELALLDPTNQDLQKMIWSIEDAGEAAAGVVSNLAAVNRTFAALYMPLFQATAAGNAMSVSLISLMGGMGGFTSATAFFVENFYTDAEKLQAAANDIHLAFAELGIATPQTSAAFRALVESQNLTTEAGRETYAALMNLAPAFNQVAQAAATAANQAIEAATQVQAASGVTATTTAAVTPLTAQIPAMQSIAAAQAAANAAQLAHIKAMANAQEAAANAAAKAEAAAEKLRLAQEKANEAAQKAADILAERYGLETRLLELQGNTSALRARELALLDPSNRALQKMIWSLEDAAEAATKAQDAISELTSKRDDLLSSIESNFADAMAIADGLAKAARDVMGLNEDIAEMQRVSALRQLRVMLETGRIDKDRLDGLVGYATTFGDTFGSQADMLRAQAKTAQTLDALGSLQAGLAVSERNIAMEQLDVLQQLLAVTAAASGVTVPAFANGGMHSGGLALVGERGPELVNMGPSRVFNAGQTRDMMQGDDRKSNEDLRKEMAEMKEYMRELVKLTVKQERTLREIEIQGAGA